MASATDLLRLLEPAVRPAGLPAGPTTTAAAPFATRSFESLLAEQAASPPPAAASGLSDPPGTPLAKSPGDARADAASPLAALAGIDRVENPALRALLGQRAA